MLKRFLISLLIYPAPALPDLPKRISGQMVDLGEVHRIYMVPGMATVLEIPGAVTGIRIGNPDLVEYYKPEKPDNEVTLVLKKSGSEPTNLIVRSGKRKFVFDIVPSKKTHQDSVEIVGAYGGASLMNNEMELISSSKSVEINSSKRVKK